MTGVPARGRYQEHVELTLRSDAGRLRVRGAILGPGHLRIVEIDDYRVSIEPEGPMIVLRNRDVPGVIGRVGSLLGEKAINIAGYHQARLQEGGTALATVQIDEPASAEVLAALRALPEIEDARGVDLG